MAIVIWPDDVTAEDVGCVVCGGKVAMYEATICATSRSEAFACEIHLGKGQSARFLRAGIDLVLQKLKYIDEREDGRTVNDRDIYRTS
jgi:hypothetical protein